MESRRIIKNRKTILACCIILLFNGLWYYYQQQSYWKNYNYSISAASKIQKNYRMELDGMSLEAQLQLIANKKEKIEKSVRHQLVARRVLILFITSLVSVYSGSTTSNSIVCNVRKPSCIASDTVCSRVYSFRLSSEYTGIFDSVLLDLWIVLFLFRITGMAVFIHFS